MAIREIGASITMDASQFKQDMKAVNSNLSGLKAEMAAVTAEFGENANSVEALSRKQQILNDKEAAAKQKVDLLSQAYQDQVDATGEASEQAAKLRKQLNYASADFAKATREAKTNAQATVEKQMADAKAAAEQKKLAEDARKLSSHVASLTSKVKEYNAEQKKKQEDSLKNRLKQLTKELKEAANNTPALRTALKTLNAAGHAASGGVKAAGDAATLTAKATGALVTGGAAAATALGTLAVSGLGKLVEYAKEAATAMDEDGNLINEKFSTLAENMTKLDAGAAAAKTALGGLLLPALESISGKGASLLQGFSRDLEAAGGDTERMAKVCSIYIRLAAKTIQEELPGLVDLGMDILTALVDGLMEAAPDLLDTAQELLDKLTTGLVEAAPSMGDGAAEIVTQLLTFILQNAPQLLTAGIQILTSLITGITDNLPDLIPVAIDAIQQLLTALVQNAPQLLVAGATLILTLVEGLIDHIPDLIAAIPGLISDFIDGFEDNVGDLKQIGTRIVEKILDGLKAAWHWLTDWIGPAIQQLDQLGPEIGYTSGYAGGLNYVPYDNYPALLHKGEKVLTAAEAASGAYGGGGNRTVNITVNTRELSRAQSDYLVRRADNELGKAV